MNKKLFVVGFCLVSVCALADVLDFEIGGSEEFKSKITSLFGHSKGLTADKVGEEASDTSYEVEAMGSNIEAAAAQVDLAIAAFYPKLSLSARYSRQSKVSPYSMDLTLPVLDDMGMQTVDPMTGMPLTYSKQLLFPVQLNQTSLQATLVVPLSDYVYKLFKKNLDAAKHLTNAAKLGEKVTRLKASREAKMLFYTWIRARLELEVAESRLKQASSLVDNALAKREAMKLTRLDLLKLEKQRVAAENFVEKVKNAVNILNEQLKTVMHDSKKIGSYEIGEDYRYSNFDNTMASVDGLYGEAFRNRLELKVLTETERAFEEQARAASASKWPKLDFTGNVTVANPNYRTIRGGGVPTDLPANSDPYSIPPPSGWGATWDVGVNLTWTFNDYPTGEAAQRKFKAQASEKRSEVQKLKETIYQEVGENFSAMKEATSTLKEANLQLEIAEEEYKAAVVEYDNARITTAEVIDAGNRLMEAQRLVVNSWLDQRVTKARLEYAVGRVKP